MLKNSRWQAHWQEEWNACVLSSDDVLSSVRLRLMEGLAQRAGQRWPKLSPINWFCFNCLVLNGSNEKTGQSDADVTIFIQPNQKKSDVLKHLKSTMQMQQHHHVLCARIILHVLCLYRQPHASDCSQLKVFWQYFSKVVPINVFFFRLQSFIQRFLS